MIDTNLLRYPEQLAARLTKMENDINKVMLKLEKLERKNG